MNATVTKLREYENREQLIELFAKLDDTASWLHGSIGREIATGGPLERATAQIIQGIHAAYAALGHTPDYMKP